MARINEAAVDWQSSDRGSGLMRKRLSVPAGSEALGCSRYRLEPGGQSGPYHYHTANEEALYVLAGRGSLRLPGESLTVRAGDYVALPADDSGAHRLYNTSDDSLGYLMISTMREPDVTVYPDDGVVKLNVGAAPGEAGDRTLDGCYNLEETVPWPGGADDWTPG